MDLRTEYLGLQLQNPLVPSASPLSRSIDSAKQLEDAGAAAIVMYSLFEEQVQQEEAAMIRFLHEEEIGFGEAQHFHPEQTEYSSSQEQYLAQIEALKQALDIPVIASLNGVSKSGWTEFAKDIASAGADALELNAYFLAASFDTSGGEIEARYHELLQAVKSSVSIPVAMKLSSQISCIPSFVKSLEDNGADGVVLFNRFYQPDINLDNLQLSPNLELSNPYEALLRMHWIAILRGRVGLDLAATGGAHSAEEVIKLLLAGADIVQLCSVLLMKGARELENIKRDLISWLEEQHYDSVEQLKGSLSYANIDDPTAYERQNYMQLLDSYSPPAGVWR